MVRGQLLLTGVLATFLLFALAAAANAQETGTITGTVIDAQTNQPLASVQVFIEGTQYGTLTDRQGVYGLDNVPAGEHTLVVSVLGYGQQRRVVTLGEGTTLTEDFRIEEQAIRVGELVVTGYQIRPRRDRTGSLTQVGRADLQSMQIQTADQGLQGMVSGTHIQASTGQPGAGMRIRVRGEGSIGAGNAPLYIIDGVQISTRQTSGMVATSPLAGLEPRDIESIEILKDAAAASIYGAQAANGVVLITTRRGAEGATEFTVSSEYGVNETVDTWDVVRGPDWVRLQMEAFGNRFEDLGLPRSDGEQLAVQTFGDPNEVGHYDWQGAITRPARGRKFTLSASGGTPDTRFFLSGSMDRQDAPLRGSDFRRLSFRTNFDHQATDRLSILLNASMSQMDSEGDIDGNCQNCPFWAAPHMRPIIPIFNEDGTFNRDVAPVPYNIAFQVHNQPQTVQTRHGVANVTVNYAIRPRLNLRSLWGVDVRTRDEMQYRPPEQQVIGDFLNQIHRDFVNWNTNQVLSYQRTLGGVHNFSTLVGGEYRHEAFELFAAQGTGFPSGIFRTLNLAATPQGVSGSTGGFKLGSGFTRVEYDYLNRFMATASLRYDGSSRFGEDFRWGLFYSGSLGWDLTQEDFFRSRFGFLDDFTLRTSYGITGNSSIGDFASMTLFGSGGSYMGRSGLRPSQLGNDLLTWEEARTVNIGFNWAALQGRAYGTLDLYRTNNEELLLGAFLPNDSGFGSVTRNAGVVRNQGIEFEIGGVPLDRAGFRWTSDFNITYTDNEIIELIDGLENIGSTTRVGHPLRIYWGAEWAGVNPADGRPMWYDADGNITYTRSSDDAKVLGSRIPDWEGGWNNTITYGPFQASALFQFVLGVDAFDTQQNNLTNIASTRGLSTKALERWQQPGDMTSVPKAYTSTSFPGTSSFTGGGTSRFIFDASYVRLRNVSVAYQLPENLANRLNATSARIYAHGRNLATWTEFPGLDPEVMIAAHNTYPNSRQLVTGLEIQF